MQIKQILTSERTLHGVQGTNKKHLLEYLAKFIQQQFPELDSKALLTKLLSRERLGSTGIGDGVALPHCRLAGLDTSLGIFVKLQDKIDFEAIDNQPVDLIFLLLVPEAADKDHLNTLGNLAEAFSDETLRKRLRQATSHQELFQLITEFNPS